MVPALWGLGQMPPTQDVDGEGPKGRFHVGLSAFLYLFPHCSLIELSKFSQPLLTMLG